MLLVPTVVKLSPIHGLGLFSEIDIPQGTVIWQFDPVIDRIIPEGDLANYPPHVADFIEVYSEYFPELGLLVLSGDNDRFTNHDDDPNTVVVLPNGPQARVVAARDIPAGVEITCDYAVIHCRAHERARAAAAGVMGL